MQPRASGPRADSSEESPEDDQERTTDALGRNVRGVLGERLGGVVPSNPELLDATEGDSDSQVGDLIAAALADSRSAPPGGQEDVARVLAEDGADRPVVAVHQDLVPGTVLQSLRPVPPRVHTRSFPPLGRPSFLFFGVLSAIALLADVGTKAWAEIQLQKVLHPGLVLIEDHLVLTLAYNQGGAWGLFSDKPEVFRRFFFLAVSVLAIGFIISLYSRLAPQQRALKWGLPLVLGGALGNLSDRIVRSSVIDFIDYRAGWVELLNETIARLYPAWVVTDHWPTFNIADVAICIGVGLMAVDMLTSRRDQQDSGSLDRPARTEGPPRVTERVSRSADEAGPSDEAEPSTSSPDEGTTAPRAPNGAPSASN